ncbi:MAG: hypothetical protein P9L92_03625 [Candidatus Electryonea clarkiae]|nr:hypothetical protein [Candidatus Electryonea clarkiae]MDP8286115.1 hypothetical protein [Candidatus Electryonea clarkiae]
MHKKSRSFRKHYDKLSPSIRKVAEKNFNLLKENSEHPSLHFKKVGSFWSVRVGSEIRALAVADDRDFIWVWIGSHDEYQRIIA